MTYWRDLYRDETEARAAVVTEALSWVGTPWAHAHDLKGGGVDCAMLLVRTFVDKGLIPEIDPRPYPQQWFLHRDTPLFLNIVSQYGRKVSEAKPGDVAMYNFGRHAAHGAVIIDDATMVHAFIQARKVIRDSRDSMREHFDSFWTLF